MIGSVGYDNEQEFIRNYIEKQLDSGTFRQFRWVFSSLKRYADMLTNNF